MDFKHLLSESIQTGFLDHSIASSKEYRPELLTNDSKKNKKVLSTIIHELEQCDEFWFSVAFVTTGGMASLMSTLLELEKKNIKGKILASQYLNFTQPAALKQIKKLKNIELRIATEGAFHSKGYLFKKGNIFDLIIGSSNLTQTALSSNKEWNLKISATDESELIEVAVNEFKVEFEVAKIVTEKYLIEYDLIWRRRKKLDRELIEKTQTLENKTIQPNLMQTEALENIARLRRKGKTKALLISATGTGKTYLSAFDVQSVKPKKFLFVVHRNVIAKDAMKTFKNLLGDKISMGVYSGKQKELNADYIFSTVQTISQPEHLAKFDPTHFEYIVIDETHRAASASYQRIINHFTPNFLLGMTATPERTDGDDIFKLFDHNIAYEIRLHRALEEEMLSPFHYYGITDLQINDTEIDELTDFNLLTSSERVNHIIQKAELYGCDDGVVRGLVFCSTKEIAIRLSEEFNSRMYRTEVLTGDSSNEKRERAIRLLEADNLNVKLDYIFTVDIFNEGIDIPKVNQIIMLRPTQSAIIFVQQLGRELRKTMTKDYLTVIDFIGNYKTNFMLPIALYGDTTYNKDLLRKLMSSRSNMIPGSSTVNFDRISKEKIFKAIDSTNMSMKKDLQNDYRLLKYRLGKVPMMVDFLEQGARDPWLYIQKYRAYINIVIEQEDDHKGKVTPDQLKLLELFSREINNSKRVEESIILKAIIDKGQISVSELKTIIKTDYNYELSDDTIKSCLINLNFNFVKTPKAMVEFKNDVFTATSQLQNSLKVDLFRTFLLDNIQYSILTFNKRYSKDNYHNGFTIYQKYSKRDVFRILNWIQNPVPLNVGGYMISPDKSNCPIFVNYKKKEDISNTTKYEDEFINPSTFQWISKSNRYITSPEIKAFQNYQDGLLLPLFIIKNKDEGTEYYFMGNVTPLLDRFKETTMPDGENKPVPVVTMTLQMNTVVEDNIYRYLVE